MTLVDGGAPWATHDVYAGLLGGLRAGGHLVQEFVLGARLPASRVTLEYLWRKQVREGGELAAVRPNAADLQYHAGVGLLERALRFEPDWVVVVCAAYLHPDVLVLCRRVGFRLAAVFTESPYDDFEQVKAAPLYDVCFTNERTSVGLLRLVNPNSHYLPAAYDPEAHGVGLNGSAPRHDVVFVGTGLLERGFEDRLPLLMAVDWTGIDLGLYGQWPALEEGHPLRPFVRHGVVDNARAGQLYRNARIALNLYRGTAGAPAESLNPRAYELAADGCFTLTQPRAEVAERFGPGVAVFRGPEQLEDFVRGSLANAPARRLGAAGLPACVAQDTYRHRAAQLVAHLN
jgi:spore maturation protein CgeB